MIVAVDDGFSDRVIIRPNGVVILATGSYRDLGWWGC